MRLRNRKVLKGGERPQRSKELGLYSVREIEALCRK
jgi:hypothetical protein